ncbi:MAG: DUF1707 domain-containing protein [Actinobacteria bacterium]|nr:MAG: DUF1707 domain-containing protein [Actinomycetota bacterium]
MPDLPALRASDADRERVIVLLREHAAAGRLTLEEFTDRMSAAYLARTNTELEELARDLPAEPAPVATRRRPTRFLFSLFGSTVREGRIRVQGRIACLMGFGNIDLDLRRATLEGDVITILALGVFGAIDVYVPEGVEVDLHGLALGGHKLPQPGTPLVRIFAVSIFAGIDVWRVPIAWTQQSFDDVIRGIRSGRHQALEE